MLVLLKKNPGIFRLVNLPPENPEKTSLHPWKLCDTLWKFQGQKRQFVRGLQSPPFLRHQLLDPAGAPFLKSLFPLPSFLFHPLLRYFRQFPLPSCNSLLPLSNQPTLFGLPPSIKQTIVPVHPQLSTKNQFLIF